MIAKSDLIILVISASALGLGMYRWQQNVAAPSTASVTAPSAPSGSQAAEDVASRPAEPLVGRPASEAERGGAAPAPTPTPASGSNEQDDGTVVVRRLPSTDAGSVTSANTGTPSDSPPDALPDAPLDGTRADGGTDSAARAPGGADASTLYGRYRVREGDYLGRIAERFGTSVATLRSINGIEDNLIFVDQELRYPLPAN